MTGTRTMPAIQAHRIGAIACLIVLMAAALGIVSTSAPAGAAQANGSAWSAFELLNQHRVANHRAPLAMHPGLFDVAQAWANHLAATGVLAHNPNHPAQIAAAVDGRWHALGENAGLGASVTEIDNAFMNSPRHRANVLNGAYNFVGIGAARSQSGRLFIVVDFVGAYGSQPTIHPGIPRADATSIVKAAYVDFFGRSPTTSELGFWVDQLANGQSTVGSFIGQMATSRAWAGRIISNLYQQTLGRDPDQAGLDYWLGQIRDGRTVANIAANFYGSSEYYRRSGSTMSGWLNALYQSVLGRPVDPSGLNYWTAKNHRGLSRGDIAYRIYQSNESLTDRVQGLYQELLGRTADSNGLDYWVDRLRRSGNDVDLAVHLATSSEYLRRAKQRY